jgi:circadian clock protein KaiB
MGKIVFKLYITGQTARSQKAVANLRRLCERGLPDEIELVIIDVLEHPHLAEQDRILATPALLKESPPPSRRIIGDLSNEEMVLQALEILAPSR